VTVPSPRPATGRTWFLNARRSSVALVAVLAALLAPADDGAARVDGSSLFADAGAAPTIDQLPPLVLDAHRAGGLEARENSMSGVRHALASGVVDVVDLDVRRLADGTLGVMHDRTVDRVTTATGPAASFTREQWQALTLDIGSWLVTQPRPEPPPTLDGVLQQFGDQSVFTVEVKEGLVDEVARLLKERGLTDSVFVTSNKPDVARLAHDLGLRSHLWRTRPQLHRDDPRAFVGFVDLLDIDVRAERADFRKAVASGVPLVWAHTVTTRAERDRALRLGANGIITDAPRYVAGLTDVYPASTTVLEVRRPPRRVQVSDRTTATVAVSSESSTALFAPVTVTSPQLSGRMVEQGTRAVTRLTLTAAGAVTGRTSATFAVAAGSAGERRWPGARTRTPVQVTGEDLQLRPHLRVSGRRLQVRVRLLDSAASGYDGPRAEHGPRRTPAALHRDGLRLRVLHHGKVVHRRALTGADTGTVGDGTGRVAFPPWRAERPGRYTVRVVQRGPVHRRVVVEQPVRLG
jgi:glycerophosphoryl diester phosphodiesterase